MGKQTEAVMRIDLPKVMKLVNGALSLEYKFPGSQSILWGVGYVVDITSHLNLGCPHRGAWDNNMGTDILYGNWS